MRSLLAPISRLPGRGSCGGERKRAPPFGTVLRQARSGIQHGAVATSHSPQLFAAAARTRPPCTSYHVRLHQREKWFKFAYPVHPIRLVLHRCLFIEQTLLTRSEQASTLGYTIRSRPCKLTTAVHLSRSLACFFQGDRLKPATCSFCISKLPAAAEQKPSLDLAHNCLHCLAAEKLEDKAPEHTHSAYVRTAHMLETLFQPRTKTLY